MTEPSTLTNDLDDLAGEQEVRGALLIEWDVGIPMDDGVVLRCDVFRPSNQDGPFPVLLTHGAYAKGLAFQDGFRRQWDQMAREAPDALAGSSNTFQNWETPDPEKWVPDGYACIRVDTRGIGSSPGVVDVWSSRETDDLYRCIEWAAHQSWSNGKIGLSGISYLAMNQWQVAGRRPPHLAAIAPWEGSSDFYRELFFHGGIRSHFVSRWFPRQVLSVQHGRGDRVPPNPYTGRPVAGRVTMSDEVLAANRRDIAADAAAHPFDDGWHRERTPDLEQVEVPVLSCANWGGAGLHLRGNFEGFLRAGSSQKWLEVHGGTHFTEYYTDYGRLLQKRFFDHFLKGDDNGWEQEPRVRLQVRHADGRFVERHESEWPLARTEWTRLYLNPRSMGLDAEIPAAGGAQYQASGDGLTFWLPPSTKPLEITGPSSLHLWISSSTVDADIFVVYRLFDPDGEEVVFQGANDPHAPVTQGWLRASHRALDPARSEPYRPFHPHDRRQPLEPGRPTELEIEVWPTSIVVLPGYRLAVTVRGSDYHFGGEISDVFRAMDYFGCAHFVHLDTDDRVPAIFDNEVTVHTGQGQPSSVLLPVVPSSSAPSAPTAPSAASCVQLVPTPVLVPLDRRSRIARWAGPPSVVCCRRPRNDHWWSKSGAVAMRSACLAATSASRGCSAIRDASWTDVSRAWPSGTTSSARPSSRPVVASTEAPVYASLARAPLPVRVASARIPPPEVMPWVTSGSPRTAPRSTMR